MPSTPDRPEVLNSLNENMAKDGREALAQIRDTSSIRALIVTGAGRAFCAGAELNDVLANGEGSQSTGQRLNQTMLHFTNPWIMDLETCRYR